MNGFYPEEQAGPDYGGLVQRLKKILQGVGYTGSLAGALRALASAQGGSNPANGGGALGTAGGSAGGGAGGSAGGDVGIVPSDPSGSTGP